jgi:hypothetical protein
MMAPLVTMLFTPGCHCEVRVEGIDDHRTEKVPGTSAVETPTEVDGVVGVKVTGR